MVPEYLGRQKEFNNGTFLSRVLIAKKEIGIISSAGHDLVMRLDLVPAVLVRSVYNLGVK